MRSRAVLATATALLLTPAAAAAKTITIDHLRGTVDPSGRVGLERNERVALVVKNTAPACYTYSFVTVKKEDEAAKKSRRGLIPHDDKVVLHFEHQPQAPGYKIEIRRRSDVNDTQCPHARDFEIPVQTYEWAVGFAGAFTYDELVDPVFFLDEAMRETGEKNEDGNPITEAGFLVRRNRPAEDSGNLGAATMVHLYHTNPRFLGWRGVSWAPFSFGLGVGEGSDLSYFLGTSVKFGDQAFLTAGLKLGERARLPDKLELGDFTTAADAITDASQSDTALFVGVSFTFLSSSEGLFKGKFDRFAQPAAQQAGGKGGEGDDEEGEGGDDEEDDDAVPEDAGTAETGPADASSRFTGEYRDENGTRYLVAAVDDGLTLEIGDQTLPLAPLGAAVFSIGAQDSPDRAMVVEFQGPDGEPATSLVIRTFGGGDQPPVTAERVAEEDGR